MSLSVRGLSAALGGRLVLRGVDLEASAGGMTAIVGLNGAGKSTLLRAVCGLLPAEGSLLVDGVELGALPADHRARLVAYVPQRSRLQAALSVRQVVQAGRYAWRRGLGGTSAADRRAVDDALARLGCAALADRTFTELSGGEQRRVLLARALATEARVLLLDEPTAFLDIRSSLQVFELLRDLCAGGLAVLAVLHDLDDVVRNAAQAVLLHEGRVQAQGVPSEVVMSPALEAAYGVRVIPHARLGFEAT